MRKSISILLSFLLVFCGMPFAASAETATETVDVQIVWDEMSFVYAPNYDGEWDSINHVYKNAPIDGWKVSDDANNITVINNTAEKTVKAVFGYESKIDGISFDFYDSDMLKLEKTETDEVEFNLVGESSYTVKVVPSGALPDTATSKTVLGTIILTISVESNS